MIIQHPCTDISQVLRLSQVHDSGQYFLRNLSTQGTHMKKVK